MPTYAIKATWDDEAKCWVAASDDVPGLAIEADTIEELVDRLHVVVPELLEANDMLPEDGDEFPFSLDAHLTQTAKVRSAA